MARRCLHEVVWKLKTESNKKYEILKQESTCRMMRQAKQRIKLTDWRRASKSDFYCLSASKNEVNAADRSVIYG